jgi:hypothetical protein
MRWIEVTSIDIGRVMVNLDQVTTVYQNGVVTIMWLRGEEYPVRIEESYELVRKALSPLTPSEAAE